MRRFKLVGQAQRFALGLQSLAYEDHTATGNDCLDSRQAALT